MHMNNIIKYFLPVFLLFLTSCTTERSRAIALSKSYSCKSFNTWKLAMNELAGVEKLQYLKSFELAKRIAPAFNDEVFKVSFGKSFSELSKNESEGIWRSMQRCRTPAWMNEVTAAFHHGSIYKKERNIWLSHIEAASKQSYSSIVAKRKSEAAARKLAVKKAAKLRRLAMASRQDKMNKRFENFKKNYVELYNRAYPEETRDEANNYANYDSSCAEKLRSRLAHCSVGPGSCDESGNCSKNTASCDKGIYGTQCMETLYLTAPRHIDYYCDIQNSRDYNENRKVVIQQICSGK